MTAVVCSYELSLKITTQNILAIKTGSLKNQHGLLLIVYITIIKLFTQQKRFGFCVYSLHCCCALAFASLLLFCSSSYSGQVIVHYTIVMCTVSLLRVCAVQCIYIKYLSFRQYLQTYTVLFCSSFSSQSVDPCRRISQRILSLSPDNFLYCTRTIWRGAPTVPWWELVESSHV